MKDKEFLVLAGGSVLAVLGMAYLVSKMNAASTPPQTTSGPHHHHHGGRHRSWGGRGWGGGWGPGWGWDYYPPPMEIVDAVPAYTRVWDPTKKKWILVPV